MNLQVPDVDGNIPFCKELLQSVKCLLTESRSGNSGLCIMARGAAIMSFLRNLRSGTDIN